MGARNIKKWSPPSEEAQPKRKAFPAEGTAHTKALRQGKNCARASGRRLMSQEHDSGDGAVRQWGASGTRAWVLVRTVTFNCM